MLLYCVKYFFLILCSFYIYKRLLNIPVRAGQAGLDTLFSGSLALGAYAIRPYFHGVVFVTVLLFWAATGLLYRQKRTVSFLTGIISLGLAYVAEYLAAFLLLPLLSFPFFLIKRSGGMIDFQGNLQSFYILLYFLTGLFQLLLSTLPFLFSRLKRGMPYLQKGEAGAFGTAVSLIILFACSFATSPWGQGIGISVYVVLVAEGGLALILWWRARIIARFEERMRQKRMADDAEALRQADERIAALEKDNERMAKLLHSDSKSLPALGAAVMKTLQTAVFPYAEDRQEAEELLEELDETARRRARLFFDYQNGEKHFPKSGVTGVDLIIRHMGQRAYEEGVQFDFGFSASINYLIQTEIMEQDLVNIIGDLVENAIIAERDSKPKNILLYISIVEQKYRLEISDSGIPFTEDTIARLGRQRVTTHADTGGSGYGMVNIFELLRKYKASLILEEYRPGGPFTKKISLCFDGLCQFRLIREQREVMTREIGQDELIRAGA